jgi:serine/threonine protein kinase
MSANSKKGPSLKITLAIQTKPKKKWHVIQEFGKLGGGMNGGIFKVAEDSDPYDRYFIEKRFPATLVKDSVVNKEITLLYQLSDDAGITKMVDHFVDVRKNEASIYLEYCDAGSLADVVVAIKPNRLVHERKLWKWFISLMDALVYCHRGPKPEDLGSLKYWNAIFHRDLKPANILLKRDTEKGEIVAKLADFGGSQSADWAWQNKKSREHSSFASIITPGFDPPEYPEFSGTSDVFQVALCIVCICTGNCQPWSKQWTKGRKVDQKLPAGRNYSKELNEILAWCLTSDYKVRPGPLEVSKKLKNKFERIKHTLPQDDAPMVAFWKVSDKTPKQEEPKRLKQEAPKPRENTVEPASPQPTPRNARPPLHKKVFSKGDYGRNMPRGNQYGDFVRDQRSPMSPDSNDEGMYGGGQYPPQGLPGGFVTAGRFSRGPENLQRSPGRRGGGPFDPYSGHNHGYFDSRRDH